MKTGLTLLYLNGLNNQMMALSKVAPSEAQRFHGNARLRRHSESLPNLDLPNDNHRNPFFLNAFTRNACSEEETIEEGKLLLSNFIVDEIDRDPDVTTPEEFKQELVVCTPQGYANPEWAKVGRELRRCADEFLQSKEREKVKNKANKIGSLGRVTFEQFKDLLAELLAEGITKERIVVLFFFCADIAIASLKETEETNVTLCRKFIEWSVNFVVERVCTWVQRNGGWGAVFGSFYQNNTVRKIAMVMGVGVIMYIGYRKVAK